MIKIVDEGILIGIKLIPNASKNEILTENDIIKVRVTAQPVENKANKALIEFISKYIKHPKSKILIIKGITSKEKTLLVKSNLLEIEQILKILQN